MGTQNSLVRAVLCGLLVSGLAGAGLSASAQQPANPEKNVEVANSVEPGRTSPYGTGSGTSQSRRAAR